MGYIDDYKRRVKNNGNDLGEAYDKNTTAFIEESFHASPTFRVLEVKSYEKPLITEMDARVNSVS